MDGQRAGHDEMVYKQGTRWGADGRSEAVSGSLRRMGARKEGSQHLMARVDDDYLDQSHGAHFWYNLLVEVQRDGSGKEIPEESGRYEIGGRTMTMTEAFWLGICEIMN